ncbi:MAG: alkaline phosphatase family protein [Phycisphaerae bacterium]|nr:alkaline phosphatase family protein [Phycisphaerae bacterium]
MDTVGYPNPSLNSSLRSWRVRLGIALALAGLLVVTGCGPGRPSRWNLHPEVKRPEPGVVIFLVDGLPPRFVEQGSCEGWLPNIQQRFYAGGTRVRRATTCIPSITYAAIATLVTGVGPPGHGLVGNRWFDPNEALFRNYVLIKTYDKVDDDYHVPTIYERIQPAPSATIQTVHRRGATKIIRNWALSGTLWFFRDYTAVDKLAASSLYRVTRWANRHQQWPTILTCYFPGVDTIGHLFGATSPEFRRAMENADHQIGRVCDWLERQGLLETTYIVLVSDHGMVDVDPESRIDLTTLIRDHWGRNTTDVMLQDGTRQARRRYYDQFDTVVAFQDGGGASVHFRGASGWDSPPPPEVVERILTSPPEEACLWNIPGVELVAYLAADDEAVIRSPRGRSRIRRRVGDAGPEYAYLPELDDVLGYTDELELAAFVAAGYHDSRAWLDATADQMIPDVVPHLIPLLHIRRAGQVVVFTQPGYSFVHEHGGHGSIHKDTLLMTFYIAGPGIEPGGTIATARSVDLVPTLLDLLGVEYDEDELDGVSLLNAGLLSVETENAVR